MARYLFVVPPLAGHVNPTISVGRELARRGHHVAWTGLPGEVDILLPEGATFFPAGDAAAVDGAGKLRRQSQSLRAAAAFQFLWEQVLVPLGLAMFDEVDATVDRWRPDVVVADQQTLAGAAVARQRRLPWATSATTSAEVVDALAGLPLLKRWAEDQVERFQSAVGLPPELAGAGDLRFSEHLVLVFSTRELVGRDRVFPSTYAFVGPSISDRPERQPFPWEWLDPELPHVLVSLGTLNVQAGRRFFATAVEALADEPLQAILVAPPELFDTHRQAPNLLVRERVPQLSLLRNLDAVVSHGGHNTVCETLAHGLPLVLAPIRDDQPVVADQVVQAGAGIRLRFARALPADLRAAVRRVLDEPAFRQAARAVQRSFEAAGGAPAAATRLENLACAV